MSLFFAFALLIGAGSAWAQDPCAKTYNTCSGGSVVLTHDASCGNGGNYFWAAIESDGNYFYNGVYTAPTLTYSTGNFGIDPNTGGIGGGWGDGENPAHVGATDENRCHYPGSMTVDIKNSNSNDPYIYFPIPEGADPNIYRYFIIRYRVNYKSTTDDLGNMELFFFNDNHTDVAHPNNSYRLLNTHVVTNGNLGQLYPKCSTDGYTEVVVDTWAANGNWKTGGKITGLRLDPISYNTNNNKQVHMSIDYIGLVTIVPPSTDNSYTMENVTANTTMNSYQINMNGSVPVTQQANSSTHMHNAAGVIYYGWTSTRSTHTVQVYPALNAGAIATDAVSRCEGDNTAVTEIGEVTAASHEAGATLSYKWYVSKDGGTPAVISGATSNLFTPDITNYNTVPGTYVFTREVISDLCEASPKTSEGSFTLTVKAKPTMTVSNQTFYTNDGVKAVEFTSTPAGATFAWTNDNTAIGLAATGTGNISFTPTNSTSSDLVANIAVTPTLDGCVGDEQNFTITVKNSVTMNDITTFSATACSGNNVTATFTSPIEGVSYNWSHSNANVTPASGSVGTTGAFSQAFTNSTNAAQTVTFSVTPTKGGINGPSKTFEVTIYPTPAVTINASATCICLGGIATFAATEGLTSYSWEAVGTDAGMPSATNTSSITVTPTAAGTMNYTVTVENADHCTNTATAALTVKPLPTITANPATQNITYGDNITPVQIAAPAGATVTTTTLPAGLTYASSAISGKPTVVGNYTITASATVEDCMATTPITINVGKKNLTVTYTGTEAANTKVYDGTPLTLSYDKLTFTGLESGDAFTAGVITTDGYKVGTYVCNAGSFERMMADGVALPSGFAPASVTSKYNVQFNVILTITSRPLEITANSASKEYDATPLTPPAPGYSFTNGTSLATTDEATITVSGSQLCPGSSLSSVGDVTIIHVSDNEDVTNCYTITKKTGTLTVTPMVCPTTLAYMGYTYPIVQVGNQCWFAENLRAEITDAVPYGEQSSNTDKFGLLYNWTDALNGHGTMETDPCNGDYVQGACPQGWAIPSQDDFNALQTYAHGTTALRSDNAAYWLPEYVGTNATNFDERGGGLFNASTNRFEELKSAAYFWTSESVLHAASYPDGKALSYCDEYYCGEFIPKILDVNSKVSIRCIRKTPDHP